MLPESTTKEFTILSYLDQNSDATQRQLSEHVGVSLGTINILLKRMVKKGLLKIERLQPNSVKYFLTPAGIANKLERTYGYIVRTYRELALFRVRITTLLHSLIPERAKAQVWFFGPDDDFSLLLKEILEAEFSLSERRVLSDIKELSRTIENNPKALVLTWDTKSDQQVRSLGAEQVNILSRIAIEG